MCTNPHRHGVFCILPPYILRAIAENGDEAQRRSAIRHLMVDPTLRLIRATAGTPVTAPSARRRAAVGPVVPSKHRTISDAHNKAQTTGGTVKRSEGDAPVTDVTVNEAYDDLGATWDFYWEVFKRNSIDDAGMPLNATVHYDKDYDNAFWDGAEMVFGDGDGRLFERFTVAVDIVGHELTHGVTEKEAGLTYFGQPGALNESMSDVFGSMVKQYKLGQTVEQADWLIGAGLLTKQVKGVALRSMKDPGTAYDDPVLGKDPQPADMSGYVQGNDDNGGVHINSGIPNRAFYLAAAAIGGKSWEGAGRVWYAALLDPKTKANTDFAAFAHITIEVAGRLFGRDGTEVAAVTKAWQTVGVI